NLWSATGTNTSNWTSDSAGTNVLATLPGATTDVHFYATNATTTNLSTALGQSFTINSLTLDSTATQNVTITAGGGVLTLNGGGITSVGGAGALTINAPVILGADQTWTNNSSSLITISGGISGAKNLTLAGSGAGGVLIN